jgi:hypothetical protein
MVGSSLFSRTKAKPVPMKLSTFHLTRTKDAFQLELSKVSAFSTPDPIEINSKEVKDLQT